MVFRSSHGNLFVRHHDTVCSAKLSGVIFVFRAAATLRFMFVVSIMIVNVGENCREKFIKGHMVCTSTVNVIL